MQRIIVRHFFSVIQITIKKLCKIVLFHILHIAYFAKKKKKFQANFKENKLDCFYQYKSNRKLVVYH